MCKVGRKEAIMAAWRVELTEQQLVGETVASLVVLKAVK
jgi:hypothetical protein